MKNLLIYTNPNKTFEGDASLHVKIQITNSLALGWKPEDIILVTNFPYEYKGVKSLVIDYLFCKHDPSSNKMPVIQYMFKQGLITDDLYWYHDLDAFQNHPITEEELNLDCDLGLTNYGYKIHWQCGSFFFKKSAEDIFDLINEKMLKRWPRKRADEKALKIITDYNLIDPSRYKLLDWSYNFQYLFLARHFYYDKTLKPLRVLHFPIYLKDPRMMASNLDNFMYGRNKLGFPLMGERLIKLFKDYGIS